MRIQDSHGSAKTATEHTTAGRAADVGRPTPLRVDAQRNLEHVLRAAREVFGELGYGAPMEDVARRARVGVGTVYRRFPSKDVLVRRIAEEETARLTEQARAALGQEDEAWSALARFLRTSAASGAGRLLPPQVLRVQGGRRGPADETARVPQQRPRPAGADHGGRDDAATGGPADGSAGPAAVPAANGSARTADSAAAAGAAGESDAVRTLLDVVGQLVDRARDAGALRHDVSVADVLLVIATAAPPLPDAAQHAEASARLLDILLEGLRSRPGEPAAEAGAVAEAAGAGAASDVPEAAASTAPGARAADS